MAGTEVVFVFVFGQSVSEDSNVFGFRGRRSVGPINYALWSVEYLMKETNP